MSRDSDGAVADAGVSAMPKKLATIVSGEPVVGTPSAEEAQHAKTQSKAVAGAPNAVEAHNSKSQEYDN